MKPKKSAKCITVSSWGPSDWTDTTRKFRIRAEKGNPRKKGDYFQLKPSFKET